MASWYINFGNGTSTGYYAVAQWAALTAYSVGDLRRQLATPAVGSERVFRCTTAGTSLASEPTWVLTAGATTTEAAGPVWTEVTGNATYNWTAPHARLANAFASGWGAAGDTFYVGHNHSETQAATLTLTGPTTFSPFQVICVDAAGSVPPVSADLRTTATITTTGAFGIVMNGYVFYRGIIFSAGTGATTIALTIGNTLAGIIYFRNCSLRKLGTTANVSAIMVAFLSSGVSKFVLDNTTVQFGATGDSITLRSCGSSSVWKNTPSAIVGATLPTTLFSQSASVTTQLLCDGVDLSALGSGKTLVGTIAVSQRYEFKNCKLGSSVTISAAQTNPGTIEVYVTNCDSAGTNYRHEKYASAGTQVVETTIVRTGGASIKGTPLSWKIVTSSGSTWLYPYEALPIVIPDNEVIGTPVTITVQGIWGGGAVPLNDEIWMEAEYFGDSGSPQGSFATSGKADILATGANLTAGSGTWGGSTTKFQMSVTITPQLKGPITLYVKAAKASSTFYIDPKPLVS